MRMHEFKEKLPNYISISGKVYHKYNQPYQNVNTLAFFLFATFPTFIFKLSITCIVYF